MSNAAGCHIGYRRNEENECGQSAKQIRVDATAVAVSARPSWFRCCRCGYGFRDRRRRRNGEMPTLWPHDDTPGLGQNHQSKMDQDLGGTAPLPHSSQMRQNPR